jgi:hypothetical protein
MISEHRTAARTGSRGGQGSWIRVKWVILISVVVMGLLACDNHDTPGLELQRRARASSERVSAIVTYTLSTPTDGKASTGLVTIVQRPPEWRIDASIEHDSQPVSDTIIFTDGTLYICSRSGQERCLSVPSDQSVENPLSILLDLSLSFRDGISESLQGYSVKEAHPRLISGLDATCFLATAQAPADIHEGELCFSTDGILLFVRSESAQGTAVMEAMTVSTTVTDKDFVPPFPPAEFPG